ncbi:MAG TPA: CoA transferase, partial [Dehalococcoidia bacterium]
GESPNAAGATELAHPLQGMRVLDLTLALAGPTCGRLLGEFGADVIKIGAPQSGGGGGYLNRGKRSLLLDVESVDGQQVFWKLLQRADIVLENFSPGSADRLGIGYEQVRARKPGVIYSSISCYGYGGPWTQRRGWERQGQAVTGIMERVAAVPAVLGPYNLVDIGTGILGAFATAAAIYHRLRTGRGQHVQASLAQTATYHQAPYMLDYAGHRADEPRGWEALGPGPMQRFYRAQDRWLFLGAAPADGARLGSVQGLQGCVDLTGAALQRALEEGFAEEPAAVWVGRLRQSGIAAQTWEKLAGLMDDPGVEARGLSVTRLAEGVGEVTMPGLSVRLSRTPPRVGAPAHRPGADAEAVLKEVGLAEAIPALERAWALQTTDLPSSW